MTIAIHKLNASVGKMPRPFSRASSMGEFVEILEHYMLKNNWVGVIRPCNIDTDEPVLDISGTVVKFYAFTEQ